MDPMKICHAITRAYLRDIQTDVRAETFQKVEGYLRSRNIKALSSLCESFGVDYLTPIEFASYRQVSAFYKKNVAFTDDAKALAAAQQSFWDAEKRCRITNKRLDYYYRKPERNAKDLAFYMSRMEADIADLLGEFRPFLESLPSLVRLTSGASAQLPKRKGQPFAKVTKRIAATPGAVKYLNALSELFGYGALRCRTSPFNRVEFVPKNWKTHRTIACEPTGNVPLQLAFDSFAKRRLRRWGINLRDQSVNQRKAQIGSIYGGLSTIDLSAASDTVSFNVVAWLFPKPWFAYLNDIRSRFHRLGGKVSEYAKFSSMGNGATFAIETLVFAAACRAVGSKHYSVYGDDIVIETHLVPKLMRLFKFLGFLVNAEKSYTTGPFRESCGFDAYDWDNITPFYLRELDDRKVTQVHLVNGLVSICRPDGAVAALCKRFVREWKLPLTPYNESTIGGVNIHPTDAIGLGLVRGSYRGAHGVEPWTPSYRSYVPHVTMRRVEDMRTLFLWHLQKLSKGEVIPLTFSVFRGHKQTFEDTSVTLVPTFSHRYRRKWVRLVEPTNVPGHLYWWSDFLLRES